MAITFPRFSFPAMPARSNSLELLAPAKNAEFGMEAILHGADAVYIGGPAFGARANAGNPVADIARLAAYAHRFNARVLLALNTILRDDELEEARQLAWQAYEAGVDALIVQDMGLLELDLPPIDLHASTQTDIRSAAKARFLQDAGFSQMVLARELSLAQIDEIARQTEATLEYFVHGALCVSFSGLCNISHAHTGRSANRGECSQICRLPYALADGEGRIIAQDKHLLSMKDNNQSANLRALIEAGIRSFKIEGRLKDLSYVKNVTAHYRKLLDEILATAPQYRRTSSGSSHFTFTPQPEKSFNRGSTDYFLHRRQADIGAFASPKFVGEQIGELRRLTPDYLEIASQVELHNGDGISWYGANQELTGLRINRQEPCPGGYRLFPAGGDPACLAGLRIGTAIFRNHDQCFERLLEKPSAERHIPLDILLTKRAGSLILTLSDDRGVSAQTRLEHPDETARDATRALENLRNGLGKLGNTIYRANRIVIDLPAPPFLPNATLNALRRTAIDALDAARQAAYRRPARRAAIDPPAPYPEDALSYLGNVFNAKARAFYARHGVRLIEPAYECNAEKNDVSLMITKHCLRYSFNLCPKEVKGLRPDPMTLHNGKEKLTLRFDCKRCEMHVIGRLKPGRTLSLQAQQTPAPA